MLVNSSSGNGIAAIYAQTIDSSSSSTDYTINCGFKADAIVFYLQGGSPYFYDSSVDNKLHYYIADNTTTGKYVKASSDIDAAGDKTKITSITNSSFILHTSSTVTSGKKLRIIAVKYS